MQRAAAGIEISPGPSRGELTLICNRESFQRLRDLVLAAAVSPPIDGPPNPRANPRFSSRMRPHYRTGGNGSKIEKVKYSGIVWCPKTKFGTWVARRNGYVWH